LKPNQLDRDGAKTPASMASQHDRDVLRSFARRINPNDASAHNNLGVLYYNKGLYDEAVSAFQRALQLDPRMDVAQANLEVAYLNSGRAGARVTELREMLRRAASDHGARWELGRTLALLGQHTQAVEEFTELLRYHPGDIGALIQLGLAAKAAGDVETAAKAFQSALEVDPNSSLVHFYLAEVAYGRGLNDEALVHLEQSLELNSENHEALYLLGFVLGDMGQHDQARAATEKAVQLNPALSSAAPNLAIQAREKYVEAAQREVPMEVSRESTLTHYNLGLAFRKKAYYAEALREYELALSGGEDRDLVEQAMAEVHLLRRDTADALRLYDGLIDRQPDSPKLLNERGVALHQSGKYNEAQTSYHAAIIADPSYAIAHNNMGVAMYHAGDPESALESFQHAIDAQPAFAKARLNQALLTFKAKRFPQAIEAFRTVLATEPENPVAWNGVGLVLAELKKYAEAKSAYARAIQARPKYAEAHYNLSFTLSNLGDFEGALRETKLAIEIEPYYVAQKLELAIDLQYEDPDLSIQPDLGQERRVDAVEDFAFEPGTLDSLFKELGHAAQPAAKAAPTGNVYAHAADLLSKGFLERAQSEVTRAMALGADRVRGGTLLGDIFSRRGLWGEALERYRDVRREASSDLAAMKGEATALLKLGRAMEARHVAELLMPMAPGDVDCLMLVASSRGDAGDPRGGLAALELARRAAPTRADVQRHIGDLAWKLRDTDAAITAYRNALQIDPQYAVARFQLANVLMERSLWLDAERELLLALDAVPTYGEATLALSRLLRRVGRPDDAMPLLIDLLQRDPYHFDGLIGLGETLLELGKRDDANFAFQRVLRFDPDHVGALYYEGAILVELERYREAVEHFQRVVDMAPATEYARKARRDIKSATDLGRRFAKAT
jgi:tetratricopeptide (TPR) repeat protein